MADLDFRTERPKGGGKGRAGSPDAALSALGVSQPARSIPWEPTIRGTALLHDVTRSSLPAPSPAAGFRFTSPIVVGEHSGFLLNGKQTGFVLTVLSCATQFVVHGVFEAFILAFWTTGAAQAESSDFPAWNPNPSVVQLRAQPGFQQLQLAAGASGTGAYEVVGETGSVNAAAAAASGVVFEPGTYLLSDQLVFEPGVVLLMFHPTVATALTASLIARIPLITGT